MVGGTFLYGAIPFFELPLSQPLVLGATLLMAGFYVEQALLRLYHNYYYFQGINSLLGKGYHQEAPISYDAAMLLLQNPTDITKAVFASVTGQHIHLAAHISTAVMTDFLQKNRSTISCAFLPYTATKTITVTTLVEIILAHDLAFVDWLTSIGHTPAQVRQAAATITHAAEAQKRAERWWSRDALSRRSSVGKALSYYSSQSSQPFTQVLTGELVTGKISPATSELVHSLHAVLAAEANTHIQLFDHDGVSNDTILQLLARDLQTDTALNAISGKQIYQLDTDTLLSDTYTADMVESAIHDLCQDAARRGQTILAVPRLSQFLGSCLAKGINVADIFDMYIYTAPLHILGCDRIENRSLLQQQWPQFAYKAHEFVTTHHDQMLAKPTTTAKIHHLHNILSAHVVNQPRAVKSVATALQRAQKHRVDASTPSTSLLFLGPEGVGKTSMIVAIANHYTKDILPIKKIDMRAYSSNASSKDFLETFCKLVKGETPTVLVLMHIDQAAPAIVAQLTTIFSTGTVTHAKYGTIQCNNCVLIGTSLVGSQLIGRTRQTRATAPILDTEIISHINQKSLLPSALVQSFDDVVLFESLLPNEHITELALLLKPMQYDLAKQGYQLHIEPAVVDSLLTVYEASGLNETTIEDTLLSLLTRMIMIATEASRPAFGNTITVTMEHYHQSLKV
jgi:ATP-dependent Clp protease ATP-binding subunit ClpA